MKLIKALIITWSFAAQAGLPPTTLSGQSSATKPTTFGTQVPYNQATSLGGINSLIETNSENMLLNPNFEAPTLSGWTCTTGTCTVESTVFSSGKQSAKIVPSANIFDFSQQVNIPANIQKQGVMGLIYNFPATCTTASIQTFSNGTAQTTVPTTSLILDGAFHSIEIPTVFGATSAKIRVFSTATCTGNIYIDKAYISQGIGYQNLMLDNTYSAQVSSGGVVSGENKDWISGNCSGSNPYNCTLVSNIFSAIPNCTVTSAEAGVASSARVGTINTSLTTTSQLSFTLHQSGAGNVASASVITCQKSGNDYLASSSAVYAQGGANYSRRAYTPTLTGFGTVSNIDCWEARNGEFDDIDCKFTAGTVTGVEARVSLPTGLTSSANFATIRNVGTVAINNTGASSFLALVEPSVTYLTFGYQNSIAGGLTKQNASTPFGTGYVISIQARVPIAGWANSAQIVGSFAGVPSVPGLNGAVDTFSFSFGTTNSTTNCTASPCSYLDQIGSAVSTFVTRSGAGGYSASFARTYSKLKCSYALNSSGAYTMSNMVTTCTSCNSQAFTTYNNSAAVADSFGTVFCQGTY